MKVKNTHNRLRLCFTLIALFLVACIPSCRKGFVGANPSPEEKKEFLRMLRKLPTSGEFYTEEAIKTACPYLPVLLALDENDVPMFDENGTPLLEIYPVMMVSRGLCDSKKYPQNIEYVLENFQNFRHHFNKSSWAIMLYRDKKSTQEVKNFMIDCLESPRDKHTLEYGLREDWKRFIAEVEGDQKKPE